MFLGQYTHSLDEKGRLTIPARFRDMLAAGAYITQGFDRNLMVMNEEHFMTIFEQISSTNMIDPNARLLRRMILSNAYQLELDRSGRILLPQQLRDFSHVDGSAVLAGQGKYFEIWNPELWEQQMTLARDPETTNLRLSALDLSTP